MPGVLDDPRFSPWPSGRFMERTGPLGLDAPRSSKKLCLVATDPRLLIEVLYGLSPREDCAYVKYGTVQRDGMYLGRCLLGSDRAVVELTQALKGSFLPVASTSATSSACPPKPSWPKSCAAARGKAGPESCATCPLGAAAT